MGQERSSLIISGDQKAIQAIKNRVEQLSGETVRLMEKKNLDGSSVSVIMITIAIPLIQQILTFVKEYANQGRVKKIKVGDIEIENPSDQLVQAMINKLAND